MNVPHNVATQYAFIYYLVDEFHSEWQFWRRSSHQDCHQQEWQQGQARGSSRVDPKAPKYGDAKPVCVKELVVVSQDMHREGGGGLIVATDGGAMW